MSKLSRQPKWAKDVLATKSVTYHLPGTQTASAKPYRFVMPEPGLVERVAIALGTVNTGATFIVDVNKNGTTIYGTQSARPTIADGAATPVAVGGTPTVTQLAQGDRISFDVDQIGSTVAGADLTVTFTYQARAAS